MFSAFLLVKSTRAPRFSNNEHVVLISRNAGTLVNVHTSSVSKLVINKGRAAFLAPEIVTDPLSGPLLRITSLSKTTSEKGFREARGNDGRAASRSQ